MIPVDKKIKKIETKERAISRDLKNLEKDDKKRDKLVVAGKKAMKKK